MARNRWLMLAGTATALVLLGTAFSWARGDPAAGSVGSLQDGYPPPSAGLLRRLAESADAFRIGRIVYLVAQDSGFYPVLGGFSTRDSAQAAARAAGPRWYVYPTQTASDGTGFEQVVLPGCYKDGRTTRWTCPTVDSLRAPHSAMRLQDVTRIEVTFFLRGGRPMTVRMDPAHAGATIYTIQDFDRFIVPYYTRLFGPEYAARQRADLLAFVQRSLDAGVPPR